MRCVEETHNLRTKLADASKELDAVRAEHQSLRAQWEDSEESRLNHNEHVRQEEEIRRGLQAQIDTTNNKVTAWWLPPVLILCVTICGPPLSHLDAVFAMCAVSWAWRVAGGDGSTSK